jgi:hypothetical protein
MVHRIHDTNGLARFDPLLVAESLYRAAVVSLVADQDVPVWSWIEQRRSMARISDVSALARPTDDREIGIRLRLTRRRGRVGQRPEITATARFTRNGQPLAIAAQDLAIHAFADLAGHPHQHLSLVAAIEPRQVVVEVLDDGERHAFGTAHLPAGHQLRHQLRGEPDRSCLSADTLLDVARQAAATWTARPISAPSHSRRAHSGRRALLRRWNLRILDRQPLLEQVMTYRVDQRPASADTVRVTLSGHSGHSGHSGQCGIATADLQFTDDLEPAIG